MGETTSDNSTIGVGAILEGRYQIVRELGAGAMGVVYEGRHCDLGKRVAVKTLHADLTQDPDLIARFRQEAQAASAIGHPNIVEVFDLGTVDGATYMVMEFLEGGNLGELLAREPTLMPERACRIISQVLSALGAAHQRGIVHRDLKPENIFLGRRGEETEFVKLLDFGIAKVFGGRDDGQAGQATPKPTQFGMVMGTPQYMSPEQARGLPVDHRTDLWAAGVVLYEMLTGTIPFPGDNYNQILTGIIDGHYQRIRELRPSVPPAIEAVVDRAMSQRREERYENAIAMRHELHRALAGGTLSAAPSPVHAAPAPALEELELDEPVAEVAHEAAAPPPTSSALESATGLAAATGDGGASALATAKSFDEIDLTALVAPDGADMAGPPPERLDAPVRPPAAEAAQAPALEPSPPRAPVGAGAFAPPPEEAELSLDLGLATSAPPVRAVRRTMGERPAARREVGTIHRPEPTNRLAGAFKAFVLLAMIAGGAGAGYRYYKLGYLITPPAPKPVAVDFEIFPSSVEITIDGEPLVTRPLMAVPGKTYVVELRAPGRLTVRRTLEKLQGKKVTVTERLAHGIAPVRREHTHIEAVEIPERSTAAEVDGAIEKIALFDACVERIEEVRRRSRDAYTASTRRGTPKPGQLPEVIAIDDAPVAACQLRLQEAVEMSPVLEALEQRGKAYVDAVAELAPMTRIAASYYAKGEFEQDRFKYGKKTHPLLVEAFARSDAAERALVEAIVSHRRGWSAHELRVVEEAAGKTGLWHLRNVALRAEAWVQQVVAEGRSKVVTAARDAFVTAVREADTYAESHPDEIAAMPGAAAYLRGIAPLRQLSGKERLDAKDRSEILVWHNKGVELFNHIVLAR